MSEEPKSNESNLRNENVSQSLGQKCLNLRFPVTIEPLVLLYTLSVGLNEVIRSNLIIAKICQVKPTSVMLK